MKEGRKRRSWGLTISVLAGYPQSDPSEESEGSQDHKGVIE